MLKPASKFVLTLLLASSVFSCGTPKKGPSQKQEIPELKNVILMIGDGMGVGQIQTAQEFQRTRKLNLFTLSKTGLVLTRSSDNFITDSGAAATAMASGVKTLNRVVGVRPDESPLTPLTKLFKDAGKKIGFAVTNEVIDATPAAFYANVISRDKQKYEIAQQLSDYGFDLFLGGGLKRFLPETRPDKKDLVSELKAKNYQFASTKSEMEKIDRLPAFGLFHSEHMDYILDRPWVAEKDEPTLLEMTGKSIDLLKNSSAGFFLMLEGSRIDHASHAGDVRGMIEELKDFDDAVGVAKEFVLKNPSSLLIVTADHETMGISLSEATDFEKLKKIRMSYDWMVGKMKRDASGRLLAQSIRSVVKEQTGFDDLSPREIEILEGASSSPIYLIAWELGTILGPRLGVSMLSSKMRASGSTGGHTPNPVAIFCEGLYAELCVGTMDNTDLPKKLSQVLGYKLSN